MPRARLIEPGPARIGVAIGCNVGLVCSGRVFVECHSALVIQHSPGGVRNEQPASNAQVIERNAEKLKDPSA
jgi:hypothetical protein